MSSLAVGVGLTAVGAAATYQIGKKNCDAIGDLNPYLDCIEPCKKLTNTTNPTREQCIGANRCNEVDDITGEKLFKNVNAREECMKKLRSNESMQYDLMAIMLAKELIEEVARDYAEKTLLKAATGKSKVTIVKQISKLISSMGNKIAINLGIKKASDVAMQKMTNLVLKEVQNQIFEKGLKNASKEVIDKLIKETAEELFEKTSTAAASKSSVKASGKMLGSGGGKLLAKELGKQGIKIGEQIAAKAAAKLAAKKAAAAAAQTSSIAGVKAFGKIFLSGLLSGALALLSAIDGIGIVLDVWDPAGFSKVPTSNMINEIRNSYVEMYKKDADSKLWPSELYESEMYENKKILDDMTDKYNETKSNEDKIDMEEARKEYEKSESLFKSIRFLGKERPRLHGGVIVYPFDAYPKYPFNENGAFADSSTEEKYYKIFMDYINKQENLVWTEDELSELIQIQKEKDQIEYNRKNLAKKSKNELKESIKKDTEKIKSLDLIIKEKENDINDMINENKSEKQIEDEKKKLNELKNIKNEINTNLNTSKLYVSDENKLLEEKQKLKEMENNSQNIENENNTQLNNNNKIMRYIIIIAVICCIILFLIFKK